ncbi:hypothetical protein [Isoptericola sp. AK164]|uniref:hypothetical protein n=1 Tax=Isoptericola sp. AK164 TaxID=3024246 RepID=UPI0024188804|nr:hypothetical protein [Isoptericola sp. AK164]
MRRAHGARPGSRDGRWHHRAALAVVLGFLALVTGHGFAMAAPPAGDGTVAAAGHHATALVEPTAPDAATAQVVPGAAPAAPCVDCGAPHHDAAMICAFMLLVVVLLVLAGPRRLVRDLPSDLPRVTSRRAVPRLLPAPDLRALGISRT